MKISIKGNKKNVDLLTNELETFFKNSHCIVNVEYSEQYKCVADGIVTDTQDVSVVVVTTSNFVNFEIFESINYRWLSVYAECEKWKYEKQKRCKHGKFSVVEAPVYRKERMEKIEETDLSGPDCGTQELNSFETLEQYEARLYG